MQIKFLNTRNEADPELARQEYIIRSILLATFTVTFIFTIISFIIFIAGKMPADTLIIYAVLSLTSFAAIVLTSKGYWRSMGIIPPLLMYFPAVNANYIGGIDAPGNFLYAMLIMFVAITYGYKKMWIALLICLATYLCLVWLISAGFVKPFRSSDTVFTNRVVITTGCLISIGLLMWISGRSYSTEMAERIKVEQLLNYKNTELNSVNEELQATIEELEATNEEFEAINNELMQSQNELIEANEKLKKSEHKFFQIFHSTPIPMTLNDYKTGEYIELNEALINQTGYTRNEMIGKNPVEVGLFSIDSMTVIRNILKKTDSMVNHELTAILKNKSKRIVLMNAYVSEFDNKKCFIAASIDITEKKSYEESLIKTQRLESLGLIAGGLAHDFNNILMGILGNLSLARLKIDNHEETISFIDNSEEACVRAQGLTRQLLTFSKGGHMIKSIFKPEKLVLNALKFNLAGSEIKASTDISAELWDIEADEGQIGQVINNLILNAVQSMPSGGTINISLENHIFKNDFNSIISTGLPKPGKFVRMTISDTGKGIPENDLAKIFDPYYTTKKSGSGLGLSVVYSIITNHNGYIDVTSEEGKGSVFTVYLPAAVQKNNSENPVKSADDAADTKISDIKDITEKSANHSDLKILIMDDEESIIYVLKGMLTHLGYKSDGAVTGSEAIEMYKKSHAEGNPYSAVIMDLTIPGDIGGKEAINILKEFNPQIKAIVSSGYSDDPVFADHSKFGFSAILRKPFRIDELSDALKKTLG